MEIQGGFKYDRDKLWLVYTQSVPVIFEPPCKWFITMSTKIHECTNLISNKHSKLIYLMLILSPSTPMHLTFSLSVTISDQNFVRGFNERWWQQRRRMRRKVARRQFCASYSWKTTFSMNVCLHVTSLSTGLIIVISSESYKLRGSSLHKFHHYLTSSLSLCSRYSPHHFVYQIYSIRLNANTTSIINTQFREPGTIPFRYEFPPTYMHIQIA
jgi:hypothetical protein